MQIFAVFYLVEEEACLALSRSSAEVGDVFGPAEVEAGGGGVIAPKLEEPVAGATGAVLMLAVG